MIVFTPSALRRYLMFLESPALTAAKKKGFSYTKVKVIAIIGWVLFTIYSVPDLETGNSWIKCLIFHLYAESSRRGMLCGVDFWIRAFLTWNWIGSPTSLHLAYWLKNNIHPVFFGHYFPRLCLNQ